MSAISRTYLILLYILFLGSSSISTRFLLMGSVGVHAFRFGVVDWSHKGQTLAVLFLLERRLRSGAIFSGTLSDVLS